MKEINFGNLTNSEYCYCCSEYSFTKFLNILQKYQINHIISLISLFFLF